MKRIFAIVVLVVGSAATIIWAVARFDKQSADAAREKSELKLRADYLEKVGWMRVNPDPQSYRSELGPFFTWYFKEVTEHFNRHGGNRDFDDYLLEIEERSKKGTGSKFESPSKDRSAEKRAVYEYTRNVFDAFKSKSYSPYWSATDKGVRLDIISADTRISGTEEKIHLPVVVWGLPRDERVDDKGVRKVLTSGQFRFKWALYDEKKKLIGEITSEGGPDGRIDWPERFVKFFPPGMLLGHYDVDKVPPNARTAELTFSISARTNTGGDVEANYVWNLEVPAAWRLDEGEAWKGAQSEERPEEEIDPAKRGKGSR